MIFSAEISFLWGLVFHGSTFVFYSIVQISLFNFPEMGVKLVTLHSLFSKLWSLESQFDFRIIQGRGNTSPNLGYLLQPKIQLRFRNDFGWATSTSELKIKFETMVSLVTFKNYLNSWVGCLSRDYTKYIVLKILTLTVFFSSVKLF